MPRAVVEFASGKSLLVHDLRFTGWAQMSGEPGPPSAAKVSELGLEVPRSSDELHLPIVQDGLFTMVPLNRVAAISFSAGLTSSERFVKVTLKSGDLLSGRYLGQTWIGSELMVKGYRTLAGRRQPYTLPIGALTAISCSEPVWVVSTRENHTVRVEEPTFAQTPFIPNSELAAEDLVGIKAQGGTVAIPLSEIKRLEFPSAYNRDMRAPEGGTQVLLASGELLVVDNITLPAAIVGVLPNGQVLNVKRFTDPQYQASQTSYVIKMISFGDGTEVRTAIDRPLSLSAPVSPAQRGMKKVSMAEIRNYVSNYKGPEDLILYVYSAAFAENVKRCLALFQKDGATALKGAKAIAIWVDEDRNTARGQVLEEIFRSAGAPMDLWEVELPGSIKDDDAIEFYTRELGVKHYEPYTMPNYIRIRGTPGRSYDARPCPFEVR